MEYAEVLLPPPSAIARIWIARGDGGPDTILPDGRYELIFNFGDAVMQDGVAQPRVMLSAETRRAVTIEPSGKSDFLGVTLRDGYAASVLRAPLHELRDRMLDLRDVDRRLDLHDRLAGVSDECRIGMITGHFRGDVDPLAHAAAATMALGTTVVTSMTRRQLTTDNRQPFARSARPARSLSNFSKTASRA